MAVLLAGQPAMAPVWHLALAARDPDPPAALADLRRRLGTDADAAVATATAWLRDRLAGTPGTVATVSHSSLVDRVLAAACPAVPAGDAVAGVVGADAIEPSALLNADGTRELQRPGCRPWWWRRRSSWSRGRCSSAWAGPGSGRAPGRGGRRGRPRGPLPRRGRPPGPGLLRGPGGWPRSAASPLTPARSWSAAL